MPFSEEIKEARLAAGLTQKEAAFQLSVSISTYRNWEAGRTEPPRDKPTWTQDEALDILRRL